MEIGGEIENYTCCCYILSNEGNLMAKMETNIQNTITSIRLRFRFCGFNLAGYLSIYSVIMSFRFEILWKIKFS